MTHTSSPKLIDEIDAFLAQTGMGQSYFGKLAVKNSEIVPRLRAGGRVWPETADALRKFMADRLAEQQRAS